MAGQRAGGPGRTEEEAGRDGASRVGGGGSGQEKAEDRAEQVRVDDWAGQEEDRENTEEEQDRG